MHHFAVVKLTCIVFNALAKYFGVSLIDVVYQGPKLQQELFNVLIHFRRYPVALCDVSKDRDIFR